MDTCHIKLCTVPVQVSWVRHRDVHILTAGEQSFTSDARFSARHNTEDEWVLLIKFVQERDAGIYECQIPTQPPQSYPITLNIIGTGSLGNLGLASAGLHCSAPCADTRLPRPPRQQRLHHQPDLHHLPHPRAPRLHLLVLQRRGHVL